MSDILVLSRIDVEQLLDMKDAIRAMEDVFADAERKEADSVGVLHVEASKYGGVWGVKPGYLANRGYIGVKISCGYPGNAAKGMPTILGAVLLCDATDGQPLCVLDAAYITAVRTGATGGVAAKYLARKESTVVGVVGTGVQGRMQALALKNLFDLEGIHAYDIDEGRKLAYVREMEEKLDTLVRGVDSPDDAVRGADIVVAVTPSKTAYLRDEWVVPGMHINAFGADGFGKKELEGGIYKKAKLVTDKVEVALEKQLFSRADVYAELGEVITGKKKGRETTSEITVFDSTGLGIQDVAAAGLAYEKAKKGGVGKWVNFV